MAVMDAMDEADLELLESIRSEGELVCTRRGLWLGAW